jgi:hypothetical protein
LGSDARILPYEIIIELAIFLYGAEFAMKKALDFFPLGWHTSVTHIFQT